MLPISVVMSVFNVPIDWLANSIESILNQTFKHFELIIVNDNPDGCELKKLLNSYKVADRRIKIIGNRKNIGLTKSLNKAIKAAQGLYIARMDSDDVSLPERLELQYQCLEEHKDIFLVGSSVRIMDRNGVLKEKVIKHTDHKHILNDMFSGSLPFYHPTIMFRNQGLLYRERFEVAQDYDFYLNLLSRGKKFNNLKQILLYYRMSDESISMNLRRKQTIFKKLALRFYRERFETGFDSYDKLDFNDDKRTLEFLGVAPEELETVVLRGKVVFALGAGCYRVAQKAFLSYNTHSTSVVNRAILRLFLMFPFLHKYYRKIRYQILRF